MGALIVILGLVFVIAVLPQMWVRSVLNRYGEDRPDFPGTGGELARHLLDEMHLHHVKVEEATAIGDHYDPEAKAVRLSANHFSGRSLAAVVVAAHEVGHAMQDATGYKPLAARTKLAKQAAVLQRIGAVVMLAAPLVLAIAKVPHVLVLDIAVGVMFIGLTVLMHATTLPVEFDASFRRALPVLEAGRYVKPEDMPAARRILKAAAFTYVAAAAKSLLDVMYWFRILRG